MSLPPQAPLMLLPPASTEALITTSLPHLQAMAGRPMYRHEQTPDMIVPPPPVCRPWPGFHDAPRDVSPTN